MKEFKSHMVKHWVLQHPESEVAPIFEFKILEQYKDCLSRQVGEAIKILYSKDVLLNSKLEYLNNCLTRITIREQSFRQEKLRARQSSHEEEKYTGPKPTNDPTGHPQVQVQGLLQDYNKDTMRGHQVQQH